MGIARSGALMLLLEGKARPFSGSILQLGRQDIYFTWGQLVEQAARVGIPVIEPNPITKRSNPYLKDLDAIDDQTFFKALGFSTVHSLDASGFEGATFIHDLNMPIPQELVGQYDVVLDAGTAEHVFNTPQLLANVHALLKPGGRVIHDSPTFNYVDHGFYAFSPTLFYDYYATNGYSIVGSFLVGQRAPLDHFADPSVAIYTPGSLDQFSIGGLNRDSFPGCDLMNTFIVAQKTNLSTCTATPQQGYYRRTWANAPR